MIRDRTGLDSDDSDSEDEDEDDDPDEDNHRFATLEKKSLPVIILFFILPKLFFLV